jgi:2-iminoacetate synthase ThiH
MSAMADDTAWSQNRGARGGGRARLDQRIGLTPDYVNPEAPWPEIERLREETAAAGKILTERLTIYPSYARAPEMWLDAAMRWPVLELTLYKRGRARPGPTFREAVLMHAIARLVLYPYFSHIQGSWAKMGRNGLRAALQAGANDLGGTLMNESITPQVPLTARK